MHSKRSLAASDVCVWGKSFSLHMDKEWNVLILWQDVNALQLQPQSHISAFISNCLWQSEHHTCPLFLILSSNPLVSPRWPIVRPVSEVGHSGDSWFVFIVWRLERVHCKYCLNNFCGYIPLGSAFPRARFVTKCQDIGRELVRLSIVQWRE